MMVRFSEESLWKEQIDSSYRQNRNDIIINYMLVLLYFWSFELTVHPRAYAQVRTHSRMHTKTTT